MWCNRVTEWRGTIPSRTATMSSFARCVTGTRCLKSLSRRKTLYGGTGNVCILVYHYTGFSGCVCRVFCIVIIFEPSDHHSHDILHKSHFAHRMQNKIKRKYLSICILKLL